MSVLIAYFLAPDDSAAAVTIDWTGGPGQRPGNGAAATGYPVVDGPGIDPFIVLTEFEALLTGRSYEDQIADPDWRPTVAERDGGQQLVVDVGDRLVDALVGADEQRLAALAGPWALIEDFWGNADPRELAEFLVELRGLALRAQQERSGLYCWVCV